MEILDMFAIAMLVVILLISPFSGKKKKIGGLIFYDIFGYLCYSNIGGYCIIITYLFVYIF